MFNQHHNRALRITRMSAQELDQAIADLVKRGYELIDRGRKDMLHKNYSYHESSYRPVRYKNAEMFKQHWAVVKKKGD